MSEARSRDCQQPAPTPLQRVVFTIVPGERSAKGVDVVPEPGGVKGQFNYYFHTLDWGEQTVPAGSFEAIPQPGGQPGA